MYLVFSSLAVLVEPQLSHHEDYQTDESQLLDAANQQSTVELYARMAHGG